MERERDFSIELVWLLGECEVTERFSRDMGEVLLIYSSAFNLIAY